MYDKQESAKLIAKNLVKASAIALPQQPPKILPLLSVLPPEWSAIYAQEEKLITQEKALWIKSASQKSYLNITRREYVLLLQRLYKLGMIEYMRRDEVMCVNGLQCVYKQDGAQRLIFDGRPANLLFHPPPQPNLPDFSILKAWQVQTTEHTAFGKLDIDNFYHRLGTPKWMWKYMALPPIQGRAVGKEEGIVVPVCTTLPMGFSHAVFLAQTAHLWLLRECPTHYIINSSASSSSSAWILLYIDDIIIGCKAASKSMACNWVNKILRQLLDVYTAGGLIINNKKVNWAAESLEGLGYFISGQKCSVFPQRNKITKVVGATKWVTSQHMVNLKDIEKILGNWVWFLVLCRPLFACLFHVYKWFSKFKSHIRAPLWDSVKREFMVLVWLADIIAMDWSRSSAPFMFSCDASLVGAGACICQVVKNPIGSTNRFLVTSGSTSSAWSPILSLKWSRNEHINILELRSLLLTLQFCAKEKVVSHQTVVALSDSKVVVGAVNKGRSSSYLLCALLRKVAALVASRRGVWQRFKIGLAPSTVRTYAVAIAQFREAVRNVQFDNLDAQIMEYLNAFPAINQRRIVERLVCALRHFFPEIAYDLPLISRYSQQLRKAFRGRTKPPMIWDVVILVIIELIKLGLPTTALGIYLQFDCFLRPNELSHIQSHHVVFPGGPFLGSQTKKILVLLPTTKSGPLQSVEVRSAFIGRQLYRLTRKLGDGVLLFPSYSVYRARLLQALQNLDLQHIGYTPHSIRHGAATMALINGGEQALPGILYRGRWESSAGKKYLQMGAAALLYARIPREYVERARRDEQYLPALFATFDLRPAF